MIQKLERQLRSRILKGTLAGRFDENKALVLSSSPRSGSTLLSQVLGAIPRSCTLFEPLHLDQVPKAKDTGFGWRTYASPDKKWPEAEAFFRSVFRGEMINGWTVREISYLQGFRSERLLVKFVRANRLYPWLCNTFDIPAPILLIRHPCAVVSSQLKYGWKNTDRPKLPSFLNDFPNFRSKLEELSSVEEYLAAIWAFDQLPAFLYGHPLPWLLITYEELILRPEKTLQKISDEWDVEIDFEEALNRLNRPSSVVSQSEISGINGWKNKLSESQISRILKTVNDFGLPFYSHELEADDSILRDPKLQNSIIEAGSV